jgi:hypothetical protein
MKKILILGGAIAVTAAILIACNKSDLPATINSDAALNSEANQRGVNELVFESATVSHGKEGHTMNVSMNDDNTATITTTATTFAKETDKVFCGANVLVDEKKRMVLPKGETFWAVPFDPALDPVQIQNTGCITFFEFYCQCGSVTVSEPGCLLNVNCGTHSVSYACGNEGCMDCQLKYNIGSSCSGGPAGSDRRLIHGLSYTLIKADKLTLNGRVFD